MFTVLQCQKCHTGWEYFGPQLKSNPLIQCERCQRVTRANVFLLLNRGDAIFTPLDPLPAPLIRQPEITILPEQRGKQVIHRFAPNPGARPYRFIPELTPVQEEAFWRYVKKGSPDECWLWQGTCDAEGSYGKVYIKGKNYAASRVMWRITHRRDPGQRQVAHTCDNPPCCNPAHLFLTDHAGNAADRAIKGRTRGPYSDFKQT